MAGLSTLAAISLAGLALSAGTTAVQMKGAADARADAEDAQKKQDAANQKLLDDQKAKQFAEQDQKNQANLMSRQRAMRADGASSTRGGTLLTSPLGITTPYSGGGGKTALGS